MNPPDKSLDFLQGDPKPVRAGTSAEPDPADRLPQAVANELTRLDGVDGAWIELDSNGPRIVGGEPIRAGGRSFRAARYFIKQQGRR